jgi:GNAT superfamily N-acetyltransferase
MVDEFKVREIEIGECKALGQLMIDVYSNINGIPSPKEQPEYFQMLANICQFRQEDGAKVLVASSNDGVLLGGVVYFFNMANYGSGGSATKETNASGFRLLGVSDIARRCGVGRALSLACIDQAIAQKQSQVILHSTQTIPAA